MEVVPEGGSPVRMNKNIYRRLMQFATFSICMKIVSINGSNTKKLDYMYSLLSYFQVNEIFNDYMYQNSDIEESIWKNIPTILNFYVSSSFQVCIFFQIITLFSIKSKNFPNYIVFSLLTIQYCALFLYSTPIWWFSRNRSYVYLTGWCPPPRIQPSQLKHGNNIPAFGLEKNLSNKIKQKTNGEEPQSRDQSESFL